MDAPGTGKPVASRTTPKSSARPAWENARAGNKTIVNSSRFIDVIYKGQCDVRTTNKNKRKRHGTNKKQLEIDMGSVWAGVDHVSVCSIWLYDIEYFQM